MHELLKRYPIVSDQIEPNELTVILRQLEVVLANAIAGDVVEFGCYEGTTSLFLQRVLQTHNEVRATPVASRRMLHVYDSFAGLPLKSEKDSSPAGEQFRPGELHATKSQLIKHFKQAQLPLPIIHKAWFNELINHDLPPTIALAFLDGDFYESITQSLQLVWPRVSNGGMVIVDDYQSESLPGVRLAVDEWLRDHPVRVRNEASLALLVKR